VGFALERLGLTGHLCKTPKDIHPETTHVILPGVGHASVLLKFLRVPESDKSSCLRHLSWDAGLV
jgi:imidazoleglycerol phosphate synthase glutamine amidotransferase subunit HisH